MQSSPITIANNAAARFTCPYLIVECMCFTNHMALGYILGASSRPDTVPQLPRKQLTEHQRLHSHVFSLGLHFTSR
jgi:hypothetical protein